MLPGRQGQKSSEKDEKIRYRFIAIVENKKTKKLTGILTDRDLALKVIGKGYNPKSIKIKKVMTKNVVTCRTTDVIQKVMNLMAEYQLRCIPVVDKENRVVGVIAQADVATRLDQPSQTAAMVKDISSSKK